MDAETTLLCTHILWNQLDSEDHLYLAMDNGFIHMIRGRDMIIPNISANANADENIVATESVLDEDATESQELDHLETQPLSTEGEKKRFTKMSSGENDDDSDDDVFEDNTNTRAPLESNATPKNRFISDEAEEEQNDDNIGDINAFDEDDEDDVGPEDTTLQNDKIDVDGEQLAKASNQFHDDYDNNSEVDDHDLNVHRSFNQVASLPEPQAPFAPSSTPLGASRRRILCWNHHGVITSRQGDGIQRTIDFSFIDSASRRPVSFRDPHNYIIGTFGEEGGLFASDLNEDIDDDDEDLGDDLLAGMSDATKAVVRKSGRRIGGKDRATGSNIYFHRFDTFGPAKDKNWHFALPEGERATGCASGEGWNAVATNRQFVRTFSSGGMQGPIVWLKGDLVTMVGRGRLLAVIYHEANPLMDGSQKLGYTIYDGPTAQVLLEGSISALSPRSCLTWAGFASDLSLFIADQEGMVSMLVTSKSRSFSNVTSKWVPMLDTLRLKKSREDHFWPIAIQDAKLICAPLKGVLHPDATRRPLTTALAMRMPLARSLGSKR